MVFQNLLSASSILSIFILATVLLCSPSSALAGYNYNFEIDRFNDIKTALFSSYKEECYTTKGSDIFACVFVHSTENSSLYPAVDMITSPESWRLLDHRYDHEANTIITYLDGSIARRPLPVDVEGDMEDLKIYESVIIYLGDIKDELSNISQIEVRVGPNEYLWKPDLVLTRKALDFEET